jgi:hypothetical protein
LHYAYEVGCPIAGRISKAGPFSDLRKPELRKANGRKYKEKGKNNEVRREINNIIGDRIQTDFQSERATSKGGRAPERTRSSAEGDDIDSNRRRIYMYARGHYWSPIPRGAIGRRWKLGKELLRRKRAPHQGNKFDLCVPGRISKPDHCSRSEKSKRGNETKSKK